MLALVLALPMAFAGHGSAQTPSLLPGWSASEDEPWWTSELVGLDDLSRETLAAVARSELGRECVAFEGFRWSHVAGEQLTAPIADISFYAYVEEHHEGVTFVDANLSGAYGYTGDEALVFYWGIPFNLWPIDGVYVHLDLCRTAD